MAENLVVVHSESKEAQYERLIPQIASLVSGEPDLIANLSNIAAALRQTFNFFWVGFYLVKDRQLVLGPFQGPIACSRIAFGKGVCGTCWAEKRSIIVPDVDEFPGHIACSSDAKSEIVLPVFLNGEVVVVMDVDSDHLKGFDETDRQHLGKVVKIVESMLPG